MDDRIIKYYVGELSGEEQKALLQEAFSNQELKKQMMEYQHLQSLMQLHPQKKNEISGKESLRRFMRIRKSEKEKRLSFRISRYAAIAIACILSTWWITYSLVDAELPQPVTQELFVPAGQRAHIVLPDGSNVWVNANSKLTYPSTFGKERRIALVGEAFFEVAKNPSAPFIVSTGKVNVKALGTAFNVFNYPQEPLSVALLEGVVQVYTPQNEGNGMRLSPNQQLVETTKGFRIEPLQQKTMLWKEGIFAFDKQKMRNILQKLELYYDVKITVKDPFILEYEYTGKFRQWDGIMEVLRIIQKIHHFKIEKKEDSNEIILYR